MKLIVKSEPFVKALGIAFDSIPAKSPAPVFMNFLIQVHKEETFITASDETVSVKVRILNKDKEEENIISSEEGSILVPAKTFFDICKNLEGSTIELDLKDNELQVSDGKTNYNLSTIDAENYPNIDFTCTEENSVKVSFSDFVKLYNSSFFVVPATNNGFRFKGVTIKAQNKELYFTASDGYRIAQRKVNIESSTNLIFSSPVKLLSMISKMNNVDEVVIKYEDNKILMKAGDSTFVSRSYAEKLESIDKIIPKTTPYKFTINSNEFLKALERVGLVLQGIQIPAVRLMASNEKAELSASSEIVGRVKEELKDFKYEDETGENKVMSMWLNSSHIKEAVRAGNSETLTLAFEAESRVFRLNSDDPSFIQLFTPVRQA